MKVVAFFLLVLSLLFPRTGSAGTRPKYGGGVRVQVEESILALNPTEGPQSRSKEEMDALLFDGLTRLDDEGEVTPSLATSWQHDGQNKLWQFRLRDGVSLPDGSILSARTVSAQLAAMNPAWKVKTMANSGVSIETDSPAPNLPAILGLPGFAIAMRSADGSPLGTGAFRLREWDPGRRALLVANDDYWGGRPYLDSIEVLMGRSIRDQLIDRRLDRDDIVQVEFDQVRNLLQANQNLSSAGPGDILLVMFRGTSDRGPGGERERPLAEDPRVRAALSLALDRASIANVLLQRQGQPANALLPGSSTGYEFLFAEAAPAGADLDRARKLRLEIANIPIVTLGYEPGDALARTVAERVVVNARDVGISLQLSPVKGLDADGLNKSLSLNAALLRVKVSSFNARAALYDIASQLHADSTQFPALLAAESPEDLYAAEKSLIENLKCIPLAHIPDFWWLNRRLHLWRAPRSGHWQLEDLWVDTVKAP